MNRRTFAFVVFAILMAGGCVRLGFWQLSRLDERRTRNAQIAGRLNAPSAPWREITRDSAHARYRRVRLTGRFDYARELVLTSRGRNGAPGVHVITPLQVGDGPVVLVNRGWAYSADGMAIDLSQWHEGDSATVDGFVDEFVAARGMVSTMSQPRGVRQLVRDSIAARLGEPIAALFVVQQMESATGGPIEHLVRADPPTLGEGSHRSYAIQWFAFAAIALIGTVAVLRQSDR